MVTSHDVAEFIINFSHDIGKPVTNLELQKLMYYVQGFHLALYGERLFDEKIQSMDHGPVVSPIYSRFNQYGKRVIDRQESRDFAVVLDQDDKKFISLVIRNYQKFSAWDLRELTHNEYPWLNNQERWGEIPEKELEEFFLPKLGTLDSDKAIAKARKYIEDRYGITLSDQELKDINLYLELEDEKRELYARLAES